MFLRNLWLSNHREFILFSSFFLLAGANAFGQAIAQKNVNAIGPTPINWLLPGNARMQQNEPGCAASSVNPDLLFCAYNDNRAVNRADIGDTGQGISMSRDGGLTWISGLGPGHLIDTISINQKTTADANVEALPNFLLHNFIGLWRDGSQPSGLYVSRYYERGREVGPPWQHLDIKTVTTGAAGRSIDKPSFVTALYDPDLSMPDIIVPIPAFEDPNDGTNGHDAFNLPVPAARTHVATAVFVGNDNNDGTKIDHYYSDDLGESWKTSKLTEGVDINQGVSLATRNFGKDVVAVWRRFSDNNETSAIMFAYSTTFGDIWSKAEVLTEFCAFDQTTGPARHRSNALPIVVSNQIDFSVYLASRNDATETCFIPAKGNKTQAPRFSEVTMEDDFDSFGENVAQDGSRIRDGEVRTLLNYSRVMMVRSTGTNKLIWGSPTMLDPQENAPGVRKRGHQYMVAAGVAGGTETVAWLDSRLDKLNLRAVPIPGGFVEDYVVHLEPLGGPYESASLIPAGLYELDPPPIDLPPASSNLPMRRNLDVFGAQVINGIVQPYSVDADWYPTEIGGAPSDSTRISRFATRKKPGSTTGERQQVNWDYPNGLLFQKGRRPFYGDYNAVFAQAARQRFDGAWVPNQGLPAASDLFHSAEPRFHVAWTSNRDVRGDVYYTGCAEWDEALQMWTSPPGCSSQYTPPDTSSLMIPLEGIEGSDTLGVCTPGNLFPLTRNQNVYVAAMVPELRLRVLSAFKDPNGEGANSFVLGLQNGTRSNRIVRLTLVGSLTSFSKNPLTLLAEINVLVPKGSGAVRTAFDFSNVLMGDPSDPAIVIATDVTDPDNPSVVARLPLLRESAVPNESVLSNDDTPVSNLDGESFTLSLNPEVGTTQLLDLENLDLENTVDLLDLENLDLENLDLENVVIYFSDLQNLDLENLDLENLIYEQLDVGNLDLENLDLENLDLENLDLENRVLALDLENLDLENLDLENLDLENLDLENLDLENLDLENLDLENFTIYASDLENLDLENLDLENQAIGDEYTEISWRADSKTNTITGVDVKPMFSPALIEDIAAAGGSVLLTVRKAYTTSTVTINTTAANFCAPQVVAENQILYAALLTAEQLNSLTNDPDPTDMAAPSFPISPDETLIISFRFFGLDDFDIDTVKRSSGLGLFAQGEGLLDCDAELGGGADVVDACEVDFTLDSTPPVITMIGDDPQTVEAGSGPYSDPGATADDDIDGPLNPASILAVSNVDTTTLGSYTVVYTINDAAGNTGTATRTVEVVDTTPPLISVPADIDREAEGPTTTVDPGTATATDFIGPIQITRDPVSNVFTLGENTVAWTATDGAGLSSSADQTVTIRDTAPPVFDQPLPNDDDDTTPGIQIVVEANSVTGWVPPVGPFAPLWEEVLATDLVDLGITATCTPDATASFGLGSTSVVCTATDLSSNSATTGFAVVVQDTTAPLIVLSGVSPQTIDAGVASYVEEGATASDAVAGDLTSMITVDSNVNSEVVGTYAVVYAVSDGIQSSMVTRTVIVVDTTDPVIVISDPPNFFPEGPFILDPGETTIEISWPVGAQDLEADLTISCNVGDPAELITPVETNYMDGTLTAKFSYDFDVGSTSATCTVMDQGDNTTTSDPFVVFVEDIPVISANEAILTVTTDDDGSATATVFDADLLANVTATDLIDAAIDLSVSCLATDPTEFSVGQHDIDCTVTDSSGNSATTTFVLDVAYRFDIQFKPPKGNVRAGSTVPLNWFYTESGTSTRADSSNFQVSISWSGPYLDNLCTTPDPGNFSSGTEANDSGSSDFRYSESKDEWIYSWQTPIGSGMHKVFITPPGEIDAATVCFNLR